MGLVVGMSLAAVASLSLNASYVVQHEALSRTPPVRLTAPFASLAGLLRSRRWLAGALLAYGGIALNLVAMSMAPLWLVQTMIAAGLVVVCAVWARLSRRRLTGRERVAIGLVGAGLAGLAVAGAGGRPGVHPGALTLAAFIATSGALALACVRGAAIARLGLAAGVLYGATTVALASLPAALASGRLGVVAVAVIGGGLVTAAGFFAFQKGLQAGDAAPVITQMTAAMNAVAITGGLLLGSGLAAGWPARVAQLAGLVALCLAAALAAGGLMTRRSAAVTPGTARPPAPRRSC